MKKLKATILSLALLTGLVAAPLAPATVGAQAKGPASDIGAGVEAVSGKSSSDNQKAFNDGIKNIVNTLLFVLGIAAVIAIILGGFRYVTANGDSGQIKTAKDIILYACVGLVVAILAFAIVNFVVTSFGSSSR